MEEPITLPGSVVLRPEDLPDSLKERNSEVHKWALDWCNKFLEADGVMVNSFLELELEAFKDLERRRPGVPPIYPVGPLIRTGTEAESDRGSECVKWLNDQPPKICALCFLRQWRDLIRGAVQELALGLEMMWAEISLGGENPSKKNAADAYLKHSNHCQGSFGFSARRDECSVLDGWFEGANKSKRDWKMGLWERAANRRSVKRTNGRGRRKSDSEEDD
ncbi:UDP-glycosyltransferase 72B1 [Sesamum alatum]|uniref:UDP-glycosyltransferase 72B1 n=1 Tax=Sesamum alatum TaxID=300844 RepID=A0AAE2CK38_9LAMI|nr:UDP-glycosyltransferase 72B1 [Sesamum alatum]